MPRHSTRLRATTAASRLLTCLGLVGALYAGGPAQAQGDAKAALVEQGNYWQSMGRTDLAEESWRKLLSIDPQSADAMYGMAQVELARGKAEPARSWITRLNAAHPGDPRGSLQAQQQSGTPQTDLQRARAASKAGRTTEAIQLYRAIFANRTPPEPLAVEYYQLLGGTQQGWEEGRKGLDQLVKDKPDNLNYKLALAQLQTYREPTRREGIRTLAELAKQPGVGVAATASWRQALIWLDAREPDAPLYTQFLASHPDTAVQARLDGLSAARSAAAPASPAAQPLGEGFKALDRGDAATAEQRFQQALKLQPGDAEALGGLGLIRLRQERFAEAQQLLEQASKAAGGGKWASALQSATYWNLIGQANAARARGDTRTAQGLLERAVKIDPRETVGQVALADLRLAAGDFAGAEQGYRRALESKPNDTQALRGLITAYTRQGRSDEAMALSQRLTPEQARQIGSLQDVKVEATRATARSQIEAGDTAGAQRTLEDAMLAAPDSPWVRLDLANIYRRQGMMAQARGVMDGLLMSQPDMPDALYASALLASDAGDPVAGLQYLERIPAASRTRDMTQLQRRLWAAGQAQQAQALARQGQVAAARGVLAQTEATLGADMPPELWGQLAMAYADIGDAPRALAMSRQLLARSPNPGVGDRLLYASVLLKTQQDVELSAVLRQLQSANMTSAQRADYERLTIAFSLRQADALREAGNLEAAYNAMAPVLAARPEDPQVLAALARLYAAARDEKQALALYQRILQRSPTDLDTLLAAAASASALRAHGEAESYVQAALKQAPDQSRVLAAAGRVYRNAGDNARAEQYLRAAVASDSRAAGGGGFAAGQPAAPVNPFAGMTGGAASAASPFGAGLQPVGLPAAGYPAAATAPGLQPSPFAGMRGGAAPVAALPPLPAAVPPAYAANAGLPAASMPWGSGAAAPAAAAGASSRNSAEARKRTAAAGQTPSAASASALPPVPLPAATPQYAQAYPLPQPAGQPVYPLPAPVAGSSLSSEGSWNALPRAGAAPVNPLLSELQDLQSERSTTIDIGSVYRSRDGESGLSRLQDLQVPIEARIPAGNGKVVLTATPTVLENGALAQDYGTSSRFGAGPQAAIDLLAGRVPAVDGQHASGVGLAVGYEGKNLSASIGTTPLGFQETNAVGNITYSGAISDTVSMKADLSRRAVTDSLLSFAGTEDTRTGDRWGGVVATGARLDVTRDDGTYGIYGYGSGHSITGRNVADNSRYELGGGMYVHLQNKPGSTLTAGMNLDLLSYDKNLSYFTYGQGGYFSPQSYVSVAFPVDWSGRDDRLSWRLNASLGVQSFTQDATPWFPTDPARQAAAAGAVATATGLGLNKAPFTGFYPSTSHTGVAYNLAGVVEYQVAPQLFLGGAMAFNNAQNYRQVTVSAYLRYMLGNTGRFGAPTGATLKPLSSPYTPLL
ncbi:cellulose biosynthesis protein BcsC [Variovorax saccharolyticus]|uniref:cellulose biosynthesis protein BcsC n=1 Tax=Variovorax saccharolyticus TaxID=3053516 RepID=UPI002577AE35|nr:cellulose biosynthesis protein BcsC [Variovorax sp. J22R187]MDM0020209.1 cellulose synthase subunit BcsC-related outer membrane protein [Variovorax sp. J22R187]